MPSIYLGETEVEYRVRTSTRVRRIRLEARPGAGLVVVAPPGFSPFAVEKLIHRHAAWVMRSLHWLERRRDTVALPRSPAEYRRRAPEALRLAHALVAKLNAHYGFKVMRVQVRNQTTRWGSCSRHGAISFNWKITLVPPELAEYVVAHELCHIGSFDHSPKFWALVAETIPDWRSRRHALHKYGL